METEGGCCFSLRQDGKGAGRILDGFTGKGWVVNKLTSSEEEEGKGGGDLLAGGKATHGVHEKFDGVKSFIHLLRGGIASLQKALYIKQRALYLFVILAQNLIRGRLTSNP